MSAAESQKLDEFDDNRLFLFRHPFISQLNEPIKSLVVGSFEELKFEFGEVIIREGDRADATHILKSGIVRVIKQGPENSEVQLNKLHAGAVFGERGVLEKARRNSTVRAITEAEVLKLDGDVFKFIIT